MRPGGRGAFGPLGVGSLLLLGVAGLMLLPPGLGPSSNSSGPANALALRGVPPPWALFPHGRGAEPLLTGVPTWTNVTASSGSPPPYERSGVAMTYDATDQVMLLTEVLGSGPTALEGTYSFDGSAWKNLTGTLATSPPALQGALLAYDPVDGYTVLYGGERTTASGALAPSNQTWSFSATGWTNRTTGFTPPFSLEGNATLAWDGADGYLLLYIVCAGGCLQPESWSYLGGTWSRITSTSVPSPRSGASMTYDPKEGYVVLFGGASPTGRALDDTWTYLGDSWSNRTPLAGTPPQAGLPSGLTYDGNAGAVLMQEGHRVSCSTPPCTSVPTSGTWAFLAGAWTNLTPSLVGAPPPGGSAFAYDARSGASVLAGEPGPAGGTLTWTFQFALTPLVVGPIAATRRADVGTGLNLSVTITGGSGTYGETWLGLPPGCASVNASNVHCVPTLAGSSNVTLQVTDFRGSTTSTGPVLVVVHPDPRIVSLVSDRAVVTAGAPVRWSATVSGGLGNGTYLWRALPPGCAGAAGNASSLTCLPSQPGNYTLNLTYTDLANRSAWASAAEQVNPSPAILAFTASPSPNASVGAALTLVVESTGGTGPLTVRYQGLPPGCASSNVTSLPCTPTRAGTYLVTVTVTDRDGRAANSTLTLDLSGGPGGGGGGGPGLGPLSLDLTFALVGLVLVVAVVALLVLRRRSTHVHAVPQDPSDQAGPSSEEAPQPPGPAPEGVDLAALGPISGPTAPPEPPLPRMEESVPMAAPPEAPNPPHPSIFSHPTPPPVAAPARGGPVCVICGGHGQLDPATGKYYCPRCDRRF